MDETLLIHTELSLKRIAIALEKIADKDMSINIANNNEM